MAYHRSQRVFYRPTPSDAPAPAEVRARRRRRRRRRRASSPLSRATAVSWPIDRCRHHLRRSSIDRSRLSPPSRSTVDPRPRFFFFFFFFR